MRQTPVREEQFTSNTITLRAFPLRCGLPQLPSHFLSLHPLSSSRCRAAHWLPLHLIPSQSASALFLHACIQSFPSLSFSLTFGCCFMTHVLVCACVCARLHTRVCRLERDWFQSADLFSMLCDMWAPRASKCHPFHSRLSCSLITLSVQNEGYSVIDMKVEQLVWHGIKNERDPGASAYCCLWQLIYLLCFMTV